MHAPRRPLKAGSIYDVANRRFVALGIDAAHRGGHALRHACASRLLAEGLSIKEIGDHLGHRSAASTSIYAKNMQALREVGAFDVGGLLMLTHVVDAYLAKQRSWGRVSSPREVLLRWFCRAMGNREIGEVTPEAVADPRQRIAQCYLNAAIQGLERPLQIRRQPRVRNVLSIADSAAEAARRNKRPMFIPQKNYTSCWTRPRS
ncbi:hypothetical protein ACVWXN_007242 [Bradyrhizobium sp. i1.4.4]